MVVAIDGPAGAGKSTVALALARRLGFTYLDSGALYRALALHALRHPGEDPGELAARAALALQAAAPGERPRVMLEGEDVSEQIRAAEVAEEASKLAARSDVREALLGAQRGLLANGDWVAEGRDIGTVVAPTAELKIYLTADPQIRARRRATELDLDADTVLRELSERDRRDRTRSASPLRVASGAHTLDTSELSVEQAVDALVELVRAAPNSGTLGPRT